MNAKLAIVMKISCLSWIVSAIETPEPSSHLRPRSYNPHPYTGGEYEHSNKVEDSIATNQYKYLENLLNQGPVQFPSNNVSPNTKEHPYEKLALKERPQKNDRFSGKHEQDVPIAYNALARHAQKVLTNRLDEPETDYDYDNNVAGSHLDKKQYAFSYTVKDKASGDDFSHHQQQVDGAVKGSYKVMLPDGRMQVVSYIADDNGYRAEVSYEGPEEVHQAYVTTPTPHHVTTAEPDYDQHYPSVNPYYRAPQVLNVRIHSYNTAPHKQLLNTKAIPSASPPLDSGSTAHPLQIQSNHLEGPIVVTTPIPQYEDIEVTPRSAYAAYHSPSKAPTPQYYDYDYQQDYIQAPSIKYARSADSSQRSRRKTRKTQKP